MKEWSPVTEYAVQSWKVLLVKVTSALLYAKTQPPAQVLSVCDEQDEVEVDADPLLSVSPEKVT